MTDYQVTGLYCGLIQTGMGEVSNMEKKNQLEAFFDGSNQLERLIECNQYTKKFGLSLTKEDAEILVKDRKDALIEQMRIEFGEGIQAKLIFAFCDSPYISQENYVDTIGRLQSIFYLYKNESLDEMTDDELIACMKNSFDGECQGSLDYLEETSLDHLARKIRSSTHQFMGRYDEEEEINPMLGHADGYEEDLDE